jgi:hypothetical protein
MIKNSNLFEQFERELIGREKPDFYKNLKAVEYMHKEALGLGVFGKDPLFGLETDIKVAKVVNNAGKTTQRNRSREYSISGKKMH